MSIPRALAFAISLLAVLFGGGMGVGFHAVLLDWSYRGHPLALVLVHKVNLAGLTLIAMTLGATGFGLAFAARSKSAPVWRWLMAGAIGGTAVALVIFHVGSVYGLTPWQLSAMPFWVGTGTAFVLRKRVVQA